jgi:hypothetical protein
VGTGRDVIFDALKILVVAKSPMCELCQALKLSQVGE